MDDELIRAVEAATDAGERVHLTVQDAGGGYDPKHTDCTSAGALYQPAESDLTHVARSL